MPNEKWFSVQSFVRIAEAAILPEQGQTYEERLTIWRAVDAEEAASLAETEAEQYAKKNGYERLDYLVAYELFESPSVGSEVWSYMRQSQLDPGSFLRRYVIEGDRDPVQFE
jgi:hypothetical protein